MEKSHKDFHWICHEILSMDMKVCSWTHMHKSLAFISSLLCHFISILQMGKLLKVSDLPSITRPIKGTIGIKLVLRPVPLHLGL